MDTSVIEYARAELNKYLELMGISADIELGLAEDMGAEIKVADPFYDDGIAISVKGGRGYIAGSNERSVLIGVYRLLYEWGARWVRPGKSGENIPKGCVARDLDIREVAAKRHRTVCIEGAITIENALDMIDWLPKMGFNSYYIQFVTPYDFFARWYNHQKNPYKEPEGFTVERANEYNRIMEREVKRRGLLLQSVGHGWTCAPFGVPDLGWGERDKSSLPEGYLDLCALVNGKRDLWRGVPLYTQLCYSNPYVRRRMVEAAVDYVKEHPQTNLLHFWLGDYFSNTCECEECTKMVYADYYVQMVNDITEELVKMGSQAKVIFCIGYDTLQPPRNIRIKNQDRAVLMFAPISRSFAESFPDRFNVKEIPEYGVNKCPIIFGKLASVDDNLAYLYKWEEIYGGDAVDFDYHLMWDHILDAGGEGIAKVLHQDIKNLGKLGMNGLISCQLQRNSFPTSVAMTVMARTLWDTEVDFDLVRRELYSSCFGKEWADVACKYFATLSRGFDIGAVRNIKEYDRAEFRANMAEAARAMEDMLPVIEERLANEDDPFLRRNWELLKLHYHAYSPVANGIVALLDGKTEEGNALRQQAIDFVWRNEDKMQAELDSMYFHRMINERIKIDSEAVFTGV